jgi:hypothetical protein
VLIGAFLHTEVPMDSPAFGSLEPLPADDLVLIRRADLPRYLPISVQTLKRWASERQGPPFIKVGKKRVAYQAGAVRAWLLGQGSTLTL